MLAGHATSEPQALERLAAGDTVEARRLLVEQVREHPDDQRARMFLFQLLCIEGAWDKARSQLRALGELSPEAQMLAAAYGQAIKTEAERAEAFAGTGPVRLLVDASDWMADLVAAMEADARGDHDKAGALRANALDACPDTPGDVDGRAFDFLFDGDGRFGPAFEATIAGRWGLISFAAVQEISTEGPVDLRDLVWLPVEIRFHDGSALAAMLPTRYPGTERDADAALRLARRTDWRASTSAVRGLGQRSWTTSGGEEFGILSFRKIRFAARP